MRLVAWSKRAWRESRKVLVAQAVLALLAAAVCAMIWGFPAGAWALMGGLICILPSLLLAARLARALSDPNINFGTAFAVGEFLKIVLVAALFALAFARGDKLYALALLLGFVAAVHGYLFSMAFPQR